MNFRFRNLGRIPLRRIETSVRRKLTIGLIPADGIGHEVIPVSPWPANHQLSDLTPVGG